MEDFNNIVSTASGLTIIGGLIALLVKPIREWISGKLDRKDRSREEFRNLNERMDALDGKIEDVRSDIQNVRDDSERDKAERSRTQILRFCDEIYEGRLHTKEHFDEILDVMSFYNDYCDQHPLFLNERTKHAQRIIKDTYHDCMVKKTFLNNFGKKEE